MKSKMLPLLFVALAPFATYAEGAAYGFFDLNYQVGGEIDSPLGTIDADGYGLKAGLPLGDNLFIGVEYLALGTDPSGLDLTDWSVSLGLHGETFYAMLGIQTVEVDICTLVLPPCAFDDDGYKLELGMRSMVSDAFELNAHVGQSDIGDVDTFNSYGIGAVLMFSANAGVSFNYDLRSGDNFDISNYGVGLRINFN
jgi:hypothetical protein